MLETIALQRMPGTCKEHDQVIPACCQECTLGCGLLAYVKDDRVVDIQGDPAHPVNRGRLCARGLAFVQGLTASERITLPGTRNRLSGPFEAFDNWEKGIDLLAERLRRIKEQHGPESLAIACDPEAGLDFFLGAQRFARLWGTPHVFHPSQEPPDENLPADRRHPDLHATDWLHSGCIFLVEADLAVTHPVVFNQVMEAQRRGAKIIAADTRFTTTLAKADRAVLIKPGRGNDLGLALMKILLAEPLSIQPQADAQAAANTQWAESYSGLDIDAVAAGIGLPTDRILELARMLDRHGPAVLITAKRLAFVPHYAIWPTLAQAMGWRQVRGGGWYPLESGAPRLDPTTDLESATDGTLQAFAEQGGSRGPTNPPGDGLKALIGSGDCLTDLPAPLQAIAPEMNLLVYFGSFPNSIRDMAHMVFPAAAWAERDGLIFNDDGAVLWSPRVVKPSDACRTGLGFWMRLAQHMGWEEHFPWKKANGLADQRAFYGWLFANNRDTADLSIEHIVEGRPLTFWRGADRQQVQGALMPAPAAPATHAEEKNDPAFPLHFQSTRVITRSGHAGRWWPWARELENEGAVQIHPLIAQALRIENGDPVLVAGQDHIMEGQAWVSRMVPPYLVWSPRRFKADRVLVYRRGQSPEQAREQLKAVI